MREYNFIPVSRNLCRCCHADFDSKKNIYNQRYFLLESVEMGKDGEIFFIGFNRCPYHLQKQKQRWTAGRC